MPLETRTPYLVTPISSRENVQARAIRILLERRLTILAVNKTRVIAECRGNSDRTYHLGWTHDRWHCHCDSKGKCSHLTALQMVTMRPEGTSPRMPLTSSSTVEPLEAQ